MTGTLNADVEQRVQFLEAMEQNMLMSFYAVAASQLAIVECKM
jgi:hypothetical protein